MKRITLTVFALALSMSFVQTAPASAGAVYIPVVAPTGTDGSLHDTEVWVTNPSGAERSFAPLFLPANTDGTATSGDGTSIPVPAQRTFLLSNVANGVGLLEVSGVEEVTVEARLSNTSANGLRTASAVPVISSANQLPAQGVAHVLGLERAPDDGIVSHLGIINLANAESSCEVKFYRSDGTQIGATATLSFKPLSMRHFDDALGLMGEPAIADARARVSCSQPFYVYGALLHQPTGELTFLTPSGSTGTDAGNTPPPESGDSIVFVKNGLLHTATHANPKGYVDVPISSSLALKKMIIDMEWVPGPWNREKTPGNHAIIWLYRGKFRSNTIANVNAYGPNKYTIKMNQNVDMPAGQVTAEEVGLQLQQGVRYHLHYIYDATSQRVTAEVSSDGQLLKSLSMAGTAQGKTLTVAPPKLNVELGHFPGQEGPEIPSWGWSYYDLRVEMVPK